MAKEDAKPAGQLAGMFQARRDPREGFDATIVTIGVGDLEIVIHDVVGLLEDQAIGERPQGQVDRVAAVVAGRVGDANGVVQQRTTHAAATQ